ncbi:MAG: hypothetical protein A2452_09600 [Candidatus Firestonebacteria bacterium RIFOXYC2_FULL_39_67]|nr:MAG: hypothetical protein A2536_09720 [Candidatus Firestonebacteria bacterium RIFOXYD2_FULL_39_29]OGF54805.1 MAG: hypothetical protein A2497_07565 [Candidatus Firestonebacteria bacterium RifOxyC12_full_39_7]OGF55258.1 MAG: hypothetical protein A2452_09600 [Candidatus Firestonebacteria bacterium RIFOXYC2_FULL_39_67]
MKNNLIKMIVVGAIIGLVLGVVANLAGAGALDYGATYNFPGADDSRINKMLEENPNIPLYERQNTVIGGAVFGLILGALIGLITNMLKSEGAYILSAVCGFLLSSFIISPYAFYKFLPPVAHKYSIWVIIPGVIVSVLISIFLERFKPVEIEPVVEIPVKQQQQGKKKNR